MTIITPSYRVNNLIEIKKSLNFEYIDEWIIVYDGNKIESNPRIFQGNNKIKEYVNERRRYISSVGSIGGGSSCVYSEYDNV